MSGIYPPAGWHLLVASIGAHTAEVIQSYMKAENVDIDDAVADLIELGETALRARRTADTGPRT
ncbi:hypothetical protein AB0M22_09055 [Nocardia sp. NPDC051756]|uniref:hypothetical protein n=1 Tax=Nocardia sp. NPDC051756 TaxID=3154751 RepID=UPI00343A34DE